MCTDEIRFFEGEKREVTAVVRSRNSDESVIIASAEYELKKQFSDEVLQSGKCEIKANEATAFLDFNLSKGNYQLEIKSNVGREVIISKVLVVIA